MNTPRTDAIREGIDARSRLRGFPTPQDLDDLTEVSRKLETQVQELREALAALVTVAPAFRAKDVGAPNSFARTAQELHIKAEDNARAILEKTK